MIKLQYVCVIALCITNGVGANDFTGYRWKESNTSTQPGHSHYHQSVFRTDRPYGVTSVSPEWGRSGEPLYPQALSVRRGHLWSYGLESLEFPEYNPKKVE